MALELAVQLSQKGPIEGRQRVGTAGVLVTCAGLAQQLSDLTGDHPLVDDTFEGGDLLSALLHRGLGHLGLLVPGEHGLGVREHANLPVELLQAFYGRLGVHSPSVSL